MFFECEEHFQREEEEEEEEEKDEFWIFFATWVFSPKNFHFAEKLGVVFVEYSGAKIVP